MVGDVATSFCALEPYLTQSEYLLSGSMLLKGGCPM